MYQYSSSSSSSSNSSSSSTGSQSPGELLVLMLFQHLHRRIQRRKQLLLAEIAKRNRRRRRNYFNRCCKTGHAQLVNDYFSAEPVYSDYIFRRRFRMRRNLFLRIGNALENHSQFFQLRVGAAKRSGLSPLQKCIVAIRQLAYEEPTNRFDEYLSAETLAETTVIDCMFNFCRCVVEVFGAQYLRKPNVFDNQRLLEMHDQRHGFPGMLGSLDCVHWEWKNCPWKDQFTKGFGNPTIVLEAVASADLWIWHAFFVVIGFRNDIKMLYESSLFNNLLQGNAPPVNYEVKGTQYTQGYYLTDGLYPGWATCVEGYSCSLEPVRKKFKERQEAGRKDVERAFRVLQSRWAIIRGPAQFWYRDNMKDIMLTCIILHNMIVEDEGVMVTNWTDDTGDAPTQASQGATQKFREYFWRNCKVRDNSRNHQLRADLIEHIWSRYGKN